MENISIVIYEDNESYRDFLCGLIEYEPGFVLKGAFSNANKCVEQIKDLMPDIVLMDLKMPNDNDGLEGLQNLKSEFPLLRVIMLTDSDKPNDIFSCIAAKPSGYINKRKVGPAQIVESIKKVKVQDGDLAFSNDVIVQMAEFLQKGVPQNANMFKLTERELEVLVHLCKGLHEKEIAEVLFITKETVHKHKQNIYTKLKVNNEMEAVKFAFDNRLLPSEMMRHHS